MTSSFGVLLKMFRSDDCTAHFDFNVKPNFGATYFSVTPFRILLDDTSHTAFLIREFLEKNFKIAEKILFKKIIKF